MKKQQFKVKMQRRYLGPEGDPPAGGTPPAPKTFTEAEVNAIVGKRVNEVNQAKAKEQAAHLQRISELETDSAKKKELEEQVENLNKQFLSKEELVKRDAEKLKNDFEHKLRTTAEAAKGWEGRYKEQTLSRDLMTAASTKELDVYSAEQMSMLLRPMSHVVEKLGPDGKPSGDFETRVKFSTVDKDGKPKDLDILPADAIKLMKDDPKKWGNFFNAGIAGGLNMAGPKGGKGSSGLMEMSQADFNKHYAKGTLPKS